MKMFTKISLVLLPAMFLLGGCGSTSETQPEAGAEAPLSPEATAAAAAAADADAASAQPMAAEPVDPLKDPNSMLSERKIFFDFDSSLVRDESMPMIRAHAEYLATNSGTSFTLEGHADERGTREYNIALGEKRADAVRRILMANGVAAGQIRIISYGEERPAAFGHSEEAWSRNRRAELMY